MNEKSKTIRARQPGLKRAADSQQAVLMRLLGTRFIMLAASLIAVLIFASTGLAAPGQSPASLREPENYRARLSLNIIPTGNTPNISIPTINVDVAKRGADRRLAFNLPQVGEVIYLEAGTQKYLVIPSRNQYVEVEPDKLGLKLPWLVAPGALIERLKAHAQFQRIGTDVINGRRAVKYRLSGETDTRTRAGEVAAESTVYIGRNTGLPLRVELNTRTTSGAGARVVIETHDVQTNPADSLFVVPTNMQKVTTEELKQQVDRLVATLRLAAELIWEQATRPPAVTREP